MLNETTGAQSAETSPDSAVVDQTSTGQQSQTAVTESQKEPTLREVAAKAFDSSTKENGLDEGAVPERDKTGEAKEAAEPGEGEELGADGKPVKTATEAQAEETEKAEDLPPFHEHPRWKEVVKERDEFKAKAVEHETRLKEYEPKAKNWDIVETYRQQHGINNQQFNEAMTFVAALNSDPAAARKMLQPVWDSLATYDADAIPADLQARVTEGEISEAAAKEMAAFRAEKAVKETTGKFSQTQTAQQAQQQLNKDVSAWDASKRQTDPEFKPKSDAKQPDGLYELTAQKVAYLSTTKPPTTIAEYIQNLETAYTESKAFLKRFATPKTPTPKTPSSSNASTARPGPPKTIREAVAQEAAKHGLSMTT